MTDGTGPMCQLNLFAAADVPSLRPSKDRRCIEVVSFEEKLALLLLTTAGGNRALIDEAIQAVADEGLSTLQDVLDYIEQNRIRPWKGTA